MLSLRNVSYAYPDHNESLKNICLDFGQGEFVLLAGPNGSGKSTLLKSILGITQAFTGGDFSGLVLLDGKNILQTGLIRLAGDIGIVLQDPESQITNLTVWEEVCFALGNLQYNKEHIKENATEALTKLNIMHLKDRTVDSLSGGQLQLLSIASLMALKPRILIFDEPLTNLDPHGIELVVQALKVVSASVDLIIVASHWLDPFMNLATRLVVLDNGTIVMDIPFCEIEHYTQQLNEFRIEVPQDIQLRRALAEQGILLEQVNSLLCLPKGFTVKPPKVGTNSGGNANSPLVELKNVSFKYENGNGLKALSTLISTGQRIAIVGHNGAGKTTLSRLLTGLRKATSGTIISNVRKPALMLQKPSLGFITDSVASEIGFGQELNSAEIQAILVKFDLERLQKRSPFELSGGEQRRLALAIALTGNPDLLVLDEPTAGLDAEQVNILKFVLDAFPQTLITITHDFRIIGRYIRTMLLLNSGELIFAGDFKDLDVANIRHIGLDKTNHTIRLASQHIYRNLPTDPKSLEVIKWS
jgi:energy-coupling factor transport system ATP-binding protein